MHKNVFVATNVSLSRCNRLVLLPWLFALTRLEAAHEKRNRTRCA